MQSYKKMYRINRKMLSETVKWACLLIFAFLLLLLLSRCYYFDFDTDHYMKSGNVIDEYAADVMPDLESLPEYKSIFYAYHCDHTYLIFSSETMLLRVSYDKKIYEAEKYKLFETYTFLDHPVSMDQCYLIPESEFSINSYEFRVIDEKSTEHTYYPHFFGLIATSDKYHRIAYMCFYDYDLDYISGSMANFVKKYFPYKW